MPLPAPHFPPQTSHERGNTLQLEPLPLPVLAAQPDLLSFAHIGDLNPLGHLDTTQDAYQPFQGEVFHDYLWRYTEHFTDGAGIRDIAEEQDSLEARVGDTVEDVGFSVGDRPDRLSDHSGVNRGSGAYLSPFNLEMPSTLDNGARKRNRSMPSADDRAGPSRKRRRSPNTVSVASHTAARVRKTTRRTPAMKLDSEDPFVIEDEDDTKVEMVDMTADDNILDELQNMPERTSTKLGKFECIICLDAASTLTVTHCGIFLRLLLSPLDEHQLTSPSRPHVLRHLPAPGHARRGHQEDLPYVPSEARGPTTGWPAEEQGQDVLPPGDEASAHQETGQAACSRPATQMILSGR